MLQDISYFLDEHVRSIAPLEDEVDTAWWDAARSGSAAHAARVGQLTTAFRQRYADPQALQRLQAFLSEDVPDPVTRRQLTLLDQRFRMNQMGPEALEAITRAEAEIELQCNTGRAELNGNVATENDLRQILHHEDDPARRRQAWEASKQVGHSVADRVLALVRLRNKEARRLGYRDYYALALALHELDEAQMFSVLDRLRAESDGPWRRFKAELDHGLRLRFGLEAHAPLHPWHYGDPFFQEVPIVRSGPDLDALFGHQDLLELSRRFFSALGLEIDGILSVSDLYERPGKCQHAFSTRLNREGDARILVNLRNTEKWASTLLHELGHAVYDKYVDLQLPWLLRAPAHMLYTEAVALFMGRFSKDEAWLREYAGIDRPGELELVSHAREQARAAQLIFARWGLVMIHFERELYRDPEQDLNWRWWQLVQDLQGVTPPPDRDLPDWAAKTHLATTPVYYQNYVLGELVASQFHHHLCDVVLAGEADPSRALVRNNAVGKWFRDRVFQPGALRPWNEALAFATGELLNPTWFVKQFLEA